MSNSPQFPLGQTERSPNMENVEIPVKYVVIHYTAVDLARTLEIFSTPERSASAHLVIDTTGEVYEVVPCLDGKAMKAFHAGQSRLLVGGKTLEKFNDFAIGIELVNLNGNVFPYEDAQYDALAAVLGHLQRFYPELKDPERIVGHEDVAGWRGKVDPGLCFDWSRVFAAAYPDRQAPKRGRACPETLAEALKGIAALAPSEPERKGEFFEKLSLLTETTVRLIHDPKAK